MDTVDLALCGGGLQNGLIVAALHGAATAQGDAAWPRVALVERGEIGGNHTWCFYESDLSPVMGRRVAPLVTHRWDCYEVRFPGYRRILHTPYSVITNLSMRSAVLDMLAARGRALVWERAAVDQVSPSPLRLTDGRELRAEMVIDARGAQAVGGDCGYQKFYGQEITLREPHGLTRPIVMDATVAQQDGFRFMYVLPLGACRVLVEDTTFSDGPDLDEAQRRRGIADWLRRHRWQPEAVTRSERGVLPMPLRVPPAPPPAPTATVLQGGYGGGWFHPGTGYSLPLAAELAELVATTPPAGLAAAVAVARRELQRRARFCCLLNRLLFLGYPPDTRRAIFERFYRLPEPTIKRFFSMRLRVGDKLRILGGRPPAGLSLSHWRARKRARALPARPAAARAAASPPPPRVHDGAAPSSPRPREPRAVDRSYGSGRATPASPLHRAGRPAPRVGRQVRGGAWR